MPKRIGIQAMVRIIIVIASASMASAQTSPNDDELPTGDVWISHAEYVVVARGALERANEVPSANTPFLADTVTPDAKNSVPLRLKLDITFTIRRADMHHRRPADHPGHASTRRSLP